VSNDILVAYDDAVARYETVIGLETHVELSTRTKLFCGCSAEFGGDPNTHVCPVCLGLPGSLPVLNAEAIASIVKIGLALNCRIAEWSRMSRKNYFYPDMPKDFQISQYDEPLCVDGYLDVVVDGDTVRVEIERVHLEEDTGKTSHVGGSTGRIHGATHSLVDYNRAGIPLVEIVTRPVVAGAKAPQIAKAYVGQLRDLLRGLDVSDVRMEQGSLRCDVNASLRVWGADKLGTRTETKNVNSLRSVERAVRFEVSRQAAVLDAGELVVQETRHFHEDTGTTSSGREKSDADDYRYFPEPDLVPLAPARDWVESLRATLPEPPSQRRARLVAEHGFSAEEMRDMLNLGVLDVVLETVESGATASDARGWWTSYLAGKAAENGVDPTDLPISPRQVARICALVNDGELTAALARQVVDGVLAGEGEPDTVIEARGLKVAGEDELLAAIDGVLAAQPDTVEKIRGGNLGAVGALIGAVMKATGGQADAKRARELILARVQG
jgi:aspartyl-tRNA(Asn)/glutamyl-tRNA(Gln) amidotransferase subunit B